MRIEPVQNESAPPDVRRIFDAVERTQGAVSNFSRMLARPVILRAYNQLYGAVWTDSALPRPVKEPAFLRVGGPHRLRVLNARPLRFGEAVRRERREDRGAEG